MKYDKRTVHHALLTFRGRLSDLRNKSNSAVLDFILKLDDSGEDFSFPDNLTIAKETGEKKEKVSQIIRKLYEDLMNRLSEKDTEITEASVCLWVHFPWHEAQERRKRLKEKGTEADLSERSFLFHCTLPHVPRVGEEVRLEFVDWNIGFNSGFVYNICHRIMGSSQIIDVEIHPLNKPYKNWLVQKEEYEEEQRRDRWIEAMERNKELGKTQESVPTKKKRQNE